MQYTSATFASAIVNVLPAFTFILAVLFRLEKVDLKKAYSLAKVIGTLATVAGAMTMKLYKGPIVDILWYSHGGSHHKAAATASADQHWITGTIMVLSCILGWSMFFILQNKTLKEYPAELSLTSLICLMGTVEGGIVATITEPHKSAWVIGFDLRLLAAAYALDGKSNPQKPKRQHNASPKVEKMNSTPSKKTKNGSRKSCSTEIPFDLTLDEQKLPTIPNLRLEAKLTAEENSRIFAGKQVHPFFASWKSGKTTKT